MPPSTPDVLALHLDERITTVETSMAHLQRHVERLETRFAGMSAELTELRDWTRRADSVLLEVQTDQARIRRQVDEIHAAVVLSPIRAKPRATPRPKAKRARRG